MAIDARSTARLSLGLVAASMLTTAVQAALFPRSWFDDFPLGRGWISAGGATYDEHLVRDVGVLFAALVIVTVWSAWSGTGMVAVAAAWVVQGVLHLVHHVRHLDGLGAADSAALVVSLALVPVLAGVSLGAALRAQRSMP
jgi:hypothetical protein